MLSFDAKNAIYIDFSGLTVVAEFTHFSQFNQMLPEERAQLFIEIAQHLVLLGILIYIFRVHYKRSREEHSASLLLDDGKR